MPRKYNLVIPVVLLAVTTVSIGSIVYGLLWKDAERIRDITFAAAQEQARTIAENIALTVADAKSALMEGLRGLKGPNFAPQLDSWQRQEPLAAFTFMWRRAEPGNIQLFSEKPLKPNALRRQNGDWIWQPEPEKDQADALSATYAEAVEPSNYAQNQLTRQKLREQSLRSSKQAQSSYALDSAWNSESTLWARSTIAGVEHWIGVIRWNNGTIITGVALDPTALNAALDAAFPRTQTKAVASMVLLDDHNVDVLGPATRPTSYLPTRSGAAQPHTLTPVGPELPGWNLAVYHDPWLTMANAIFSPGGIATGLILLLIFATGFWLAWQSRSSQRDAAQKVTFVSNVSHELKTPLTTIRMYSELLQTGRVIEDQKRAKYLDTIAKESQRLTRMVNNVLDFSQLERGKANVRPIPQPLSPVVQSLLDTRRFEIERQGFTLQIEMKPSTRNVYFDADALTQILGNLIDNVLKYATNGRWLRVHADVGAEYATITVADRGNGLPKCLRGKRFHAFKRGDTSLVAEQSGFGLGLSIAQALAEEMDGRLEYEHPRSKDEEPRFVLTLRAAQPSSAT